MEKITGIFKNPNRYLLAAIYLLLIVFALAKVRENGDFIGYVNAGNLVLDRADIYSDMFNTWPPVFSIFSVPLALVDSFSFVFVRLLWMIFMFFCFFFSIKSCLEILNKTRYTYKELLTVVLAEPYYLLALFLSCRSFMDNLIYMQINVVMLAACCYYMQYAEGKKSVLSSVLLGLSIGAKVYNIMLLPVIVLFRKWISVWYVLLGVASTFLLCFAVFGINKTIYFYQYWYTVIASVKQTIVHRNQSLIAGLMRLFSNENITVNEMTPFADLPYTVINYIFIAILGVCGLIYIILFARLIKSADKNFVFHSSILVLTMIPVVTPVSWKANYIYALPAFFIMAHMLKSGLATSLIKSLFILACLCLCLSNEALIGRPAMYFLEKWNVLIAGEMILFFTLLLQMNRLKNSNYYNADSQ